MSFLAKTAIVVSVVALHIIGTLSTSMFTISDDRVRGLDITPNLGRGYSIMTNQFYSTCLMVEETTTPSYNYDFYYTDFTRSTNDEETLQGQIAFSFSLGFVKVAVRYNSSVSTKRESKYRLFVSTMRIERYYASVREEVSPLSPDALSMLANEDYVGFFKACGPNYTRGVRRAQEVSAVFKFESDSTSVAKDYTLKLRGDLRGNGNSSNKFKQQNQSLEITMRAFGMGLSQKGSETLVATNLEDYSKIMKFAFESMTRVEGYVHVGMVYGIEFVPWVYNSGWQVAARTTEEVIETPMPRSLIPKAYPILKSDAEANLKFENLVPTTRAKFRCRDSTHRIDKYGYCCEVGQLYNTLEKEYRLETDYDETKDVCRPLRILDPTIIKDNMANNGEFVARMESAFRTKLSMISLIETCITSAANFPTSKLHNYLERRPTTVYDATYDVPLTLLELQLGIDPKGDYSLMKHMTEEFEEWMDMFYTPCYAALFGTNIGTTPDVDVNYFRAYPWHHHEACMELQCLVPSMRWDRKNGGCVASLIQGNDAADYDGSTSSDKCSKNPDVNNLTNEQCKYLESNLEDTQKEMNECWDKLPIKNIYYLVENYCNPQLLETTLPWSLEVNGEPKRKTINELYNKCRDYPSDSPFILPTSERRRLSLREEEEGDDEEENDDEDRIVPLVEADSPPVFDMIEDEEFAKNLKRRVKRTRKLA